MNKYIDNYFNPGEMTFKNWGNKFKIIYEDQFIPYPPHEDEWHLWGAFITHNEMFFNIPLPSKDLYPNWKPWAVDLVNYLVASNL